MADRRSKGKPTLAVGVLSHTNRMGDTYYLHEGTTKTGKPRFYFAKALRAGALATMPDEFEVVESINGVVSVRRKRGGAPTVPGDDVDLVRAAVAEHAHLRDHRVESVGGAIVVFEPHPSRAQLRRMNLGLGLVSEPFVSKRMKQARFDPILKFEREGDEYAVYRMTFRGEGGWSYPLDAGKLRLLAKKYVRHVGTDELFELM
jgi:hypothetical protein